jgi:hypothetical protein
MDLRLTVKKEIRASFDDFGGTPIRERERLKPSYLIESNTPHLSSRNKWPRALVRLTSLRETERLIRKL